MNMGEKVNFYLGDKKLFWKNWAGLNKTQTYNSIIQNIFYTYASEIFKKVSLFTLNLNF